MSEPEPREEAVFEAALRLAVHERAAYLDQTCAGDPETRRRVEVLLGAFERAGGFMKQPAAPEGPVRFSLPSTEKPGDKIGRYKLLEQIGEGGCGVVYVADQEEPVRRRVALKVIKLGMDTKQVIARFDAERQALAMMDHPNIAKVLDAGATETGRPYFVMELVRGVKITDYCDQHQLSPRERLDLFIQVCRAIQHAHQKGVIHRDIKPSNMLVTLHDGVPVPKVIDFGIAKATQGRLTDQTLYTAFEQFIGTPAYMSPEQAELSGLDIDTRSDIYSLGVLLYELLTGKTPFDAKELLAAGLDEMRRTIREVEPIKPSTRLTQEIVGDDVRRLTSKPEIRDPKSEEEIRASSRRLLQTKELIHLLRGDLDWIVMKCLEKDRTRRYETANGLAGDIQRHLSNEAVTARPPSNFHRLQKTIQRNTLAFAAGISVALALVAGLTVSTAMFFRAQSEKMRALTAATRSEQTAQFLKDMLKSAGPSVALGRDTRMLREIVDKTAERIGTDLKKQPEVEIDMRLTLARVYLDLQLYKKTEENATQAVQLARAHLGEENLAAADAYYLMGRAQFYLREIESAEASERQAIAINRKLRGPESVEEAAALETLGDALRHRADRTRGQESKRLITEAETAIRQSLAIRQKRLGPESDEAAWSLYCLNLVLGASGRPAEAETAIRQSVDIFRKNHGDEHPWTAYASQHLGWLISKSSNRLDEAEAIIRKSLEIRIKNEGDLKATHRYDHGNLAGVLERQNKLEEAETHYRIAVTITQTQLGADNPDLVGPLANLAGVLRKQKKLIAARPLAEEAVSLCNRLRERVDRNMYDKALQTLKNILTDLGDTAALEKLDAMQPAEAERRPSPAQK